MNYIKSPFNYIGGKYKLLPQIIPTIPKTDCFLDLFGGGFNVGLNTHSNTVIYNDMITPLVDLWKYFYDNNIEDIITYIHTIIKEYNLSKENKDTFNRFRTKYNQSDRKHPLDLFILMCYSFNYQLRYNNKGEYNSSHGTNRSSYNKNIEKRLKQCTETLKQKECYFYNENFSDIQPTNITFTYLDPPYLLGTGNYNDGNRGFRNWTPKEEKKNSMLI